MPKIPHGSGLDARTSETAYLRNKGFGHSEIRAGVTEHGGIRVVEPGVPLPDFGRGPHGWAQGFPIGGVAPPPPGACDAGQLDFSCVEASAHVVTIGL